MKKLAPQLVAVLAALAVAVVALLAGPRTPHVSEATTGDAELAQQVRTLLADDNGYQTLHVTVVTRDSVRHAGLGTASDGRTPDATMPLELGSITKTFNGQLLADAVTRGEVRATDKVSQHIPDLAGSPIGEATLEALASHRAGIPSLPAQMTSPVIVGDLTGGNPYTASRDQVIAWAKTTPISGAGTVQYSNLGAALLGQALAAAAKAQSWQSYVSQRLLTPLGMTHTAFAAQRSEIPAGALPGVLESGRSVGPWLADGFAPAGPATWTTADDMARYAQALLKGTAPGMDALTPRWEAGPRATIGYHWFTNQRDGRTVTWHNGATARFSTLLVLDREAGKAVLVFGSTTRAVDGLGNRLVTGSTTPVAGLKTTEDWITPGVMLLVVLGSLVGLWRTHSRLGAAGHALTALSGLVLLAAFGPWAVVPGWVFALVAGATAYGVVAVLPRLRTLPTVPTRQAWLTWLSLVLSGALLVAACVCVWPRS